MDLFGRKHKEEMQRQEFEHQEREKEAERAFQAATDEANRLAEREKRQVEMREAAAKRASQEAIAKENASVEKEKSRLIAEAEADERQKRHEDYMAKIAAEQSINETAEKEQTRRAEISASRDIEISNNERLVKEAEGKERTCRDEISANRDIEISNNERLVKEKEYEYKAIACKELSSMFSSYLSAVTESHKQEIEMLIHINTTRKEKYLKSLESARAKQTELLELSKQASGQEKAIYLNELSDIESSIRNLQEEDKEADELLTAKLMDLKEVQKIEMAAQQEKMISTNSILLGFNGDEQ